MPSRAGVSRNREEANCGPSSVVSVERAAGLPSGSRGSPACSTAAGALSVRQRCERFQPTISCVQQPITQIGPAYRRVSPDCCHVRLPDLIRLAGFQAAPILSSSHPYIANAPANLPLASPAPPACDSLAGLLSTSATTPRADSPRLVSRRMPPRSVHRSSVGPTAPWAPPGSTGSIG
jgi:hypothetical protein